MIDQSIRVKICGLSQEEDIEAALMAGADYIGFVFFLSSPRHVSLSKAHQLSKRVKNAQKVALTVDASDREMEQIVDEIKPDLLQLHGEESPQQARALSEKFGIPIMKAIGVRSSEDLTRVDDYDGSVNQFLIDAKPIPGQSSLPGGNGLAFDWQLLNDWQADREWMLAGGLTALNVRLAIERTGATQVDVSSGVEISPGQKCGQQIAAFVNAAKGKNHES